MAGLGRHSAASTGVQEVAWLLPVEGTGEAAVTPGELPGLPVRLAMAWPVDGPTMRTHWGRALPCQLAPVARVMKAATDSSKAVVSDLGGWVGGKRCPECLQWIVVPYFGVGQTEVLIGRQTRLKGLLVGVIRATSCSKASSTSCRAARACRCG